MTDPYRRGTLWRNPRTGTVWRVNDRWSVAGRAAVWVVLVSRPAVGRGAVRRYTLHELASLGLEAVNA